MLLYYSNSLVNSSKPRSTPTTEKPPYSYVALIAMAIEVSLPIIFIFFKSFFTRSAKFTISPSEKKQQQQTNRILHNDEQRSAKFMLT